MQNTRRTLIVALGSLLLGACGFQLSGYYEVPKALQQVRLVSPSDKPSNIRLPLQNLLKINGVQITEDADKTLEILSEDSRRRTLTLTDNANAIEYELIGTVHFRVTNRDGKILLADRKVTASRVYNNNDNTTARDALEAQLRQTLQKRMAQQIVRQYLSLKI